MSRIVAARFDTFDSATALTRDLTSDKLLPRNDVDVIYVAPPGQHAQFLIGGDELADTAARKSTAGALIGGAGGAALGAAVVGSLVGAFGGAVAACVGAYLGALVGSFARARERTPDPTGTEPQQKALRSAGVLVTVCVDRAPEREVVAALRSHGGKDVEVAEGVWRDGQWKNFDPVSPPTLVNPEKEKA